MHNIFYVHTQLTHRNKKNHFQSAISYKLKWNESPEMIYVWPSNQCNWTRNGSRTTHSLRAYPHDGQVHQKCKLYIGKKHKYIAARSLRAPQQVKINIFLLNVFLPFIEEQWNIIFEYSKLVCDGQYCINMAQGKLYTTPRNMECIIYATPRGVYTGVVCFRILSCRSCAYQSTNRTLRGLQSECLLRCSSRAINIWVRYLFDDAPRQVII